MEISFGGNPFADAGYAAMCAAAQVSEPSQLNAAAITRAVEKLFSLMLSDAAFQPRRIVDGKTAKITSFSSSEMMVIFTKNGVLSQSSYSKNEPKRKQIYKARVLDKRDQALAMLRGEPNISRDRCFVDGQPACFQIGNDEFPLVYSRNKRNFHPSLREGHSVGALTALALEFFPLSVLRTGVNLGSFWFIHTAYAPIAVACADLTISTMEKAISKNDAFGFFGDWNIGNRRHQTAFVALIRHVATGTNRVINWNELDKSGFPITAYIFSNDSRDPRIQAQDLPHDLFAFFTLLHANGEALNRFNYEVLGKEQLGFQAARAMLQENQIISMCLVRPKNVGPEYSGLLMGGWQVHAIYAKEVLNMNSHTIRDIENIAARIVEREDAKNLLFSLSDSRGRAALLRLSRKKVITDEEFARLIPPDYPDQAARSSCDYIRGAIYEMQRAEADGQQFQGWQGEGDPQPDKHSVVQLAQEIGAKIVADPNAKRFTNAIADVHPRRPDKLRDLMVRFCKRRLITWEQFIKMFPPEHPYHAMLVRYYLLAYLYTTSPGRAEDFSEPQLDGIPEVDDEVLEVA